MKDHTITFKDKSNGCHVTRGKGCFLFLLAAAACVIVGVCVFYLHPDYDKDDDSSMSRESVYGDTITTTSAAGVTTATSTAPADTTTTATTPADVRLPLTLQPQHYNLHLRPDIYQQNSADFAFTGK